MISVKFNAFKCSSDRRNLKFKPKFIPNFTKPLTYWLLGPSLENPTKNVMSVPN